MILTRKSTQTASSPNRLARGASAFLGNTIDRRTFLRRSGLAAGGAAALSQLPFSMMRKAEAADKAPAGNLEVKRTVCTHCSVGCSIDAVVQNGVWIRQEPVFDSPINLGAHCAKGASIREHGMHEISHRLRTPMKLVGGKWEKISWDVALAEVSDKLMKLKKEHGPDSTFWIGSSKHNNEQSYLFRKFVSFFGTNNMDHQARICHSTTVAGVANTFDQEMAVAQLKVIRKIWQQPALEPYKEPGDPFGETDAQMFEYAKMASGTVYHPVGTVSMGPDERFPLDPQLRVRGVEGLRVIDASVFPRITSGNTNAPTIMVAEKGAEMILQDAKEAVAA